MGKSADRSEATTAYLRLLGNPYASLQIDEEALEASTDVAVRAHIRLLENPYAVLSMTDIAEDSVVVASNLLIAQDRPLRGSVTKSDFKQRCRRIFRQYIPALEKGKLRSVHRDFISRNEVRSPTARHDVLVQLERYDLSAVGGLNPQFNREREELTDEKLRKIETLVDKDIRNG